MTNEQRALVRETWLRCQPTLRQAGASSTSGSSRSIPTICRLFAGTDMTAQQRKLVVMLTEIVAQLDRPESLVPNVSALGRQHLHYGVKEADYETVGAALLWTIEQGLGDSFIPPCGRRGARRTCSFRR